MNEKIDMIKTVTYFYRNVWKYSKLYFILVLISIVTSSLTPFVNIVLMRNIVNELIGGKNAQRLIYLVCFMLGSTLVLTLLSNMVDYLISIKSIYLDDKFKQLLGRKSMEMDYEHIENAKILELSEKATTGMSFYSGGIRGLNNNIIAIFSNFLILLGVIYIISSINIWLVIGLLLIIIINLLIQYKIKDFDIKFWNSAVGINRTYFYFFGIAKDYKSGKDVRIHNVSNLILKRLDKFIESFNKISSRHFSLVALFGLGELFLSAIQIIITYIYLSWQVVSGVIGLGDYTMYLSATNTFVQSFKEIVIQILDLRKKSKFMSEYVKLMQIPFVKTRKNLKINQNLQYIFEFRNVSFKYPGSDEYILKNVNIKINPCEKLSIVGLNGAGKTTFIKLLTRLYDPTEGEIILDGINIKEYDYEEYLKLFSVVFQDYSLLALTMRENIILTGEYDSDKFNQSIIKAGLNNLVSKMQHGIDTPLYKMFDTNGYEISGGESQKIAIARAFYKDAPIVILDEPTAALDPYAEYEIYSHFDKLIENKTAIYISHRMSSCKFCDVIALFDGGKIIQYGNHNELIKAEGKYLNMYKVQSKYYVKEPSEIA